MRKFNLVGSEDSMGDAFYIFCPPFTPKSPPPGIQKSQTIDFKDIFITLDWFDDKICGIEISDCSKNLNLPAPNVPKSQNPPEIKDKLENPAPKQEVAA